MWYYKTREWYLYRRFIKWHKLIVIATWWKYSSSKHSTHASDIITGLHSFDMSQALIKIIFKEVRWSSELKSKFSSFCLNASNISAWRDMSVASIKIIISWNKIVVLLNHMQPSVSIINNLSRIKLVIFYVTARICLKTSGGQLANMLQSGCERILNETAQWWFSRGDISLYRTAISVRALIWYL